MFSTRLYVVSLELYAQIKRVKRNLSYVSPGYKNMVIIL